jgi:hypothetical protein
MEPWSPDARPEEQLLVVSPELALVDPELAAAARAALPDRPLSTAAAVPAAPLEPPEPSEARPAEPPRRAARPPRRRVRRPVLLCVFAAALVLGVAHARDPVQGVMAGGRLDVPGAARQPGVEAAAAGVEARTPPKVLIWPQVAGAAAYRVELFRGGVRIYGGTTRETRLELPFSWRYEGLRRELVPGAYRWIVYPLLPQGTALAQGDAVVRSEWVIPRSTRAEIPLDG